MPDSAVLARERAVAHAELAHFLTVHVPDVRQGLLCVLQEAVLDFRGVRVERTAAGEASLVSSAPSMPPAT